MPIFDAGDYSQENTEYLIPFIANLSGNNDFFKTSDLFYFNIYLGDKYLRLSPGIHPFHVCRYTDYGFLFTVFHEVNRAAVIGKNVMFPSYMDTCVTMVWTAPEQEDSHIQNAIRFADEVIRNIEFATGFAFPIGLGELQQQTNFEVAHAKIEKQVVDRISLQHARSHIPSISPKSVPVLNALMGFDDNYERIRGEEPVRSMTLAGRWQQKAMRAYGASEYSDCVVCCGVWAETFLVRVTVELMSLACEPLTDVKGELHRGLPQFLNRFLGSKFLKGNWDHTTTNTEVGKWYRQAYELRNQVVHEAHLPTRDEAFDCYKITHEFVRSVSGRLGKLKDKRLEPVVRYFREMPS